VVAHELPDHISVVDKVEPLLPPNDKALLVFPQPAKPLLAIFIDDVVVHELPDHFSVVVKLEPLSPPNDKALLVFPQPAKTCLATFKADVVAQELPDHFSTLPLNKLCKALQNAFPEVYQDVAL